MAEKGGEIDQQYGEETRTTQQIENYASQIRGRVTELTGNPYTMFAPTAYRQHILHDGENFIIKINVGDVGDGFIHVKVFVPQRDHIPVVAGIQKEKTARDWIEVFNV